MFKIILFMHGNLAAELIRASAMVFGEQDGLEAYGLELGCDVDQIREDIKMSLLNAAGSGQDVLVLTDLMNGTPFNTMMQLERDCSFSHFTGINFPLLLEVLNRRMSQPLAEAIRDLETAAKDSICNCDKFLEEVAG